MHKSANVQPCDVAARVDPRYHRVVAPAKKGRSGPGLDELLPVKLFRALSDPTRVALLIKVLDARRPLTVGEVAAGMPVDTSVVSRHLAALRDAELLVAERRGKEVCYRMERGSVAARLRQLADALDSCCCAPEPAPKARRAAP